jgi:CRP/FNR family cyclic AMP-dependent transcriptional regulator
MKRTSYLPLNKGKFLRGLGLFAGISEASVLSMASASRILRYPKGSTIFFQDDPAEALYLVHKGTVAIVLTSIDGRELVINEMRDGELFGELAILTGQPRSTGALATTEAEVMLIPRQVFMKVVESEPKVTQRLLELTAHRLCASSGREGALAFMDADARLAKVLLEQDARSSDTGFVTISQEELARHTGLTRQTVAKSLGRWRRAGWLLTGRGKIVLLDRAAIAEIEKK